MIGRKVKGERGNIVRSRAAALDKRKRTLLPQIATQGKKNAFIDRRIGEKDASLTAEEKALMRFSMERKVGVYFACVCVCVCGCVCVCACVVGEEERGGGGGYT